MRRAEANTCYAYTHCHNGEVSYGFRMVGEVGETWFEDETYTVFPGYIHNEDATWTGFIARRFDGDKLIMKKDYNRLKDMVENARVSIAESLKKVGRERDRELQAGDYLLHYYVDHEVSSTCYKILEISEYGYKVISLLDINKHAFCYKAREYEFIEDHEREWIENALLIDEAQCAKAIAAALDVHNKVVENLKTLLYGKR